jgi:hypothetical protein
MLTVRYLHFVALPFKTSRDHAAEPMATTKTLTTDSCISSVEFSEYYCRLNIALLTVLHLGSSVDSLCKMNFVILFITRLPANHYGISVAQQPPVDLCSPRALKLAIKIRAVRLNGDEFDFRLA